MWELARKLYPNDEVKQKAWIRLHQRRLLDQGKIEKLVFALRSIVSNNPEVVEKIRTQADYFERNAPRMRYVKADSSSVTIYDRVHEIVSYPRSWRRGQTFGADRFEAEVAELRPAARRSRAQQRLFLFLEGLCSKALLDAYLRDIAETDRALSRQLTELLELIRQYGPEVVANAIEKASAARAFGADYVANILRQQQCPRRPQPPLRLRDPLLNELATDPLSLLEYDAFILNPGKEPDDPSRTETESTESVHHEPPTRDDPD